MDSRTQAVTPLIAVLALCLGSASFAAGVDHSTNGNPPPNTTGWILVSKPKRLRRPQAPPRMPGAKLFARADGTVLPGDNPIIAAAGILVEGHEPNCPCKHYHGFLNEKQDPDPEHCGWGCVIPAVGAPGPVVAISRAVMLEQRAINQVDTGGLAGAIEDVLRAIDAIHDAQLHPPSQGPNWGHGDEKKYQKNLNEAENADEASLIFLRNAQDESDPNKLKRKKDNAKDKLNDGLKSKGSEILHLAKKLGLGDGDD
jgi:hypothetical protein